jgi:RNA polymerase sigma factor (sigma-70 family)
MKNAPTHPLNTRLVRIIARKFAGTNLAEEDLVQEGLLAYMRAEATFDPDKEVKFETYANRVITNRFIDLARKQGEAVSELREEVISNGVTIDDEMNLLEIKKILHEQVGELERAIFNSYIEGFTYEEISKIFELPRKKIDNTVQKVKKIIKGNF